MKEIWKENIDFRNKAAFKGSAINAFGALTHIYSKSKTTVMFAQEISCWLADEMIRNSICPHFESIFFLQGDKLVGLLVLTIEIRKETLAKVHRIWLLLSFWIIDTCPRWTCVYNPKTLPSQTSFSSLNSSSSSSSSSLFLSDRFYLLLSLSFFFWSAPSLFLSLFLTSIDCIYLFAGYNSKSTLTCLSCYSILLLF